VGLRKGEVEIRAHPLQRFRIGLFEGLRESGRW
jgi:hypothetical protein